MQRLGPQDALYIYTEGLGWPMHMGSVQIFDAAGAPEGLDLAKVREFYRHRLPLIPAYRQRLVRSPGGLGRPGWVEDEAVDVDAHIHGVRLPEPGGDHQLCELIGELHSPLLDQARPLWDIWVIEGLTGGRVAVYTRLHHAATDARRGEQIGAAINDLDAATPLDREGSIDGPGDHVPPLVRRLGGVGTHLATSPVRAARTAVDAARSAGSVLGVLRRKAADLTVPMLAPRMRFNGPVTSRRGYALCSLSLPPVKKLARQEQVTVNDVVLALVGGALRRYLADRGELPDRSLTAVVPIALSDPTAPLASGNLVGVMFASLGSDTPDLVERLHGVARSADAGKALQEAIGPRVVNSLLDVPPPAVFSVVVRAYRSAVAAAPLPPMANVTVSNVRGSPVPLYLAGARMVSSHPVGPVVDGLGLNVTMISHIDSLGVGISVCPDVVEDPWRLVEALHAEMADLEAELDRRGRGGLATEMPAGTT